MAKAGKTISNKKTGESITWLETSKDTNGKRLVFNFSVAPNGKLPVVHFHPNQTENFEIKSGEFCLKIGNEERVLRAGESITIGKGMPHQWWNPSTHIKAEMKVSFEPALNTEIFLEQFYGLGNEDKTKADGTPNFLQIMAMVNEYEIYISGPPLPIQKIMGFLLGGIARVMGYKKYYSKYSEL